MGARACLDALNSPSDPLFPAPGQPPSNYDRRGCEYNLLLLHAAFRDYMRQHPELNLPSNITDRPPPPNFPQDSS